MGEDLERLKQRLPLLEYLQRHNWTARPAGARKSLLGCVHCIGKAALPSTSMPARICSIVTDVGAAAI